jgi:hypothetical protein
MPDEERRTIRVEFFCRIDFDLSIPAEATEGQIDRLIEAHTREASAWFDSLPKPTILGDGNMRLIGDDYDWQG